MIIINVATEVIFPLTVNAYFFILSSLSKIESISILKMEGHMLPSPL
jgi:hypothetical protein